MVRIKVLIFILSKLYENMNLSWFIFVLTRDVISLVPEHGHAGEGGGGEAGGGRHTRGPVPQRGAHGLHTGLVSQFRINRLDFVFLAVINS